VPTTGTPPAAGAPTWSVAPEVVQPGQRWTFSGSGFRPGERIDLEAFGGTQGGGQADAAGNVRFTSAPADLGACSLSPMTLEVTRGSLATGDHEVLGTVTVHFCS
jgi:hypothetical protein